MGLSCQFVLSKEPIQSLADFLFFKTLFVLQCGIQETFVELSVTNFIWGCAQFCLNDCYS